MTSDPRRLVPRTDDVLDDPRLVAAAHRLGRTTVKAAVVAVQERVRRGETTPAAVVDDVLAALPAAATTLRPVINATGVVLHTNLGRAPLSPAARDALLLAAGYVDLEYDVRTGSRAGRGHGALCALWAAVPAAEEVLIVNNGAAALVLAVTTIAAGKEVIVSRGEMVEIGDGFRLPDLVTSTGARLRDVGTTNRTTFEDYARAVGPETGCVLKVHPSNFRVEGFTGSVGVAELATLGPPVVVDIGSGLLHRDPLLPDEPDATSALNAGAALVTASGDKLLGGPQAGLVLGRAELVMALRRHPLARALRVDKLTLAAFEATINGPETLTHQAIHVDLAALQARTTALAERLAKDGVDASAVESQAAVGGGGAPGVELASCAISLPSAYADRLRQGEPCIVGRIERDRCLLDLRCVPAADDDDVHRAVLAAGG